MKNGKLKGIARRGMSLLLAAVMVVPFGLFAPDAEALEVSPKSGSTKFVVWDKVDGDVQDIAGRTGYDGTNLKYSRIMFYNLTDNNTKGRFFNVDGSEIKGSHEENQIKPNEEGKIENSAYREWNKEVLSGKSHFVSVGGLRTPYLTYAGNIQYNSDHSYHSWYLHLADKNTDDLTQWVLCGVDNQEKLYTIYNNGSGWGEWDGKLQPIEPWVIGKTFVGMAGGNVRYDNARNVIWHWDTESNSKNESICYNDVLDWYHMYNTGTNSTDEWDIYLGREFRVPTLTEDFTVQSDQITTLGRPMFYIPKGLTLTVADGGILSVDGVLFNDGSIVVEDGGLLILKDTAKVLPLTKYDNDCGHITSRGSIVVERDAVLCGGAINGIRLLGGGVVNFGLICGEDITISNNYTVENRDTGWVVAGRSPTATVRNQYVYDAIEQNELSPTNPKTDLGQLSKIATYNIATRGVYGQTSQVEMWGDRSYGSATDPTITVYTRSDPWSQETTLFQDAKLDSFRYVQDGDKMVFYADNEKYEVERKLVSATIGRGGKSQEKLFENLWAGPLDEAYVQLSPASAPGSRLAVVNSTPQNGAPTILWEANSDRDQWWRLSDSGEVDGRQTYYIDNVKSENMSLGLDIGGSNSVKSGDPVPIAGHSDGGNDQKWFLEDAGGGYCYIVNAANPGVCLNVSENQTGNGAAINVFDKNSGNNQKWKLSLFNEQNYGRAASVGTAAELVPLSGTDRALSGANTTGDALVGLSSRNGSAALRWILQCIGTDNLDGRMTPYYQIVNAQTGRALDVQSGSLAAGRRIATTPVKAVAAGTQYWYVTPGKNGTYSIVSRTDSNFALALPSTEPTVQAASNEIRQQWLLEGVTALTAVTEAGDDPFDGKTFALTPAGAEEMHLSVVGGGTANRTQMDIQPAATVSEQLWTFRRAGSVTEEGQERPYYMIRSALSGKNLDSSAGTENGTRPYLWTPEDNNRNQEWFVESTEDGYYTLSPRSASDKCLGVAGTVMRAGAAVQLDQPGGSNQKWTLTETEAPDLFDGKIFTLTPSHATSMHLNIVGAGTADSTQMDLQPGGLAEAQYWTIRKAGTVYSAGQQRPYYTLTSVLANKNLDSSGAGANGARPQLWSVSTGNTNQEWFIDPVGDGYYNLSPRNDASRCLGVSGGERTAGAWAVLWDNIGSAEQKWRLDEVDQPKPFGTFTIQPKHAQSSAISLLNNSDADRTGVVLWAARDDAHARWTFTQMGVDPEYGPFYKIINSANGKSLDVQGYNAAEKGKSMMLFSYDGNDDQLWYLDEREKDANGVPFYALLNRNDRKLCIGISGGNTANGTAAVLWDDIGSEDQKFKLTEYFAPVDMGMYEFGPADAPDKRLDTPAKSSGNSIRIHRRNMTGLDDDRQVWKIVQRGNDLSDGEPRAFYSIESLYSGLVLDVDGTNVVQKEYYGYSDQHWYMEFRSDNSVVFLSRENPAMALETAGTERLSNVQIGTYRPGSALNQKWQLHSLLKQNGSGYYVPGNKAASEAGFPFVPAADTPVSAMSGIYFVYNGRNDYWVINANLTTESGNPALGTKDSTFYGEPSTLVKLDIGKQDVSNRPRSWEGQMQAWYAIQIQPRGIDFYDGGGRVCYVIYSSFAKGEYANLCAPIATNSYDTIKAGEDLYMNLNEGYYSELWYAEEVGGKQDTYYFIGRGTWKNKVCLQGPNRAMQSGYENLTTGKLTNADYQQWTFSKTMKKSK